MDPQRQHPGLQLCHDKPLCHILPQGSRLDYVFVRLPHTSFLHIIEGDVPTSLGRVRSCTPPGRRSMCGRTDGRSYSNQVPMLVTRCASPFLPFPCLFLSCRSSLPTCSTSISTAVVGGSLRRLPPAVPNGAVKRISVWCNAHGTPFAPPRHVL